MLTLHCNRDRWTCLRGGWILFFLAFFSLYPRGYSQLVTPSQNVVFLKLEDFLRLVLNRNETLQTKLLEMEIDRRHFQGEKGIFEPELVLSYDYVETKRENTAEQQRSQGVATFQERNNIYESGIESLLPMGTRVRLGYTLRDLHNNLLSGSSILSLGSTGFTNQYSTFFGLTMTQPLLKNGWRAATMANIRLAALASDVAFQEYRRQLMLLISSAEAAYWNLYMAQEQLLFFRESVHLAETILRDNRTRFQAGRGSELEILEAESGLALRRSRQSEALQKYYEAANRMAMLYSESVVNTNRMLVAVEEPEEIQVAPDFFRGWQNAFELNPDYVAQQKKLIQEKIRVAYARNQRWPQLDLKASYGLNGLGETPGTSWDDVGRADFPSWSIGFEVRIPFAGGVKSRNELAAAKIRQKQALLAMKELETQIGNGLDTALRKISSSRDSITSYQKAVEFTQNLLDSQLARLDVGKVESRKVLETESDLFEAKNSVVEALVNYRRAILEWELVQGSVLKDRQLEISKEQLESRTAMLVRNDQMSDQQYDTFLRYLRWEYQKNQAFEPPAPPDWNYSTPIPSVESAPKKPMSRDEYEKALEMLRQSQSPLAPTQP
jgi:outer membrane protein